MNYFADEYDTKRMEEEVSLREYNVVIGLVLFYGFAVNYFMCRYLTDVFMFWNPIAVIIGYFILSMLGIHISKTSNNPFKSFIGYNFVVVPVGVVLSISLAQFNQDAIMHAIIITGSVTVIMVVQAFFNPKFFLSLRSVLFVALLVAVIGEIILLFTHIVTPALWDTVIAVIFSLYIGYDWAKAQEEPHTWDNAVDSCVGLYLDIINLFLRALSSNSKSSKK